MKKLISISLITILIMFFGSPITSGAEAANKLEESSLEEIINNDRNKKVSIDENGIEITEITDPKTLKAIESYLPSPDANKELKSFEIHRNNQSIVNEFIDKISPQYISSLKRTGTRRACGVRQLPGARTTGKGPIHLNVTQSITTTINGGGGVTLGIINANFGTSLSNSHTVSSSASYTAPKGKTGVIQGFAEYTLIDYNIYRFGIKWGNGYVRYGDGICFSKWY